MREHRVDIRVQKAARYGANVYRAGTGSRHLIAAGWTIVHRTYAYAYLRAPEARRGKTESLTLMVPDDEEIHAAAAERHHIGIPWRGMVAGWAAQYQPARPARIETVRIIDPICGRTRQEQIQVAAEPACFTIGEGGVWQRKLQLV